MLKTIVNLWILAKLHHKINPLLSHNPKIENWNLMTNTKWQTSKRIKVKNHRSSLLFLMLIIRYQLISSNKKWKNKVKLTQIIIIILS